MNQEQKILVVTPRFPYPEAGACEQDRAEGIRQLERLGFKVRVLGKYFDWQNPEEITAFWRREGVPVVLTPYIFGTKFQQKKWKKYLHILRRPWHVDGSVLEYAEPKTQAAFEKELDDFRPDLVWFDYSYLWPLYASARKRHIPIVVRSINFEAKHFLDEDGRSLVNYVKFIPKYITECITARQADVLFAITPAEEDMYRRFRSHALATLPLRSLARKLGTHTPRETDILHIFFSGSTYNVQHNRKALEFIVREIAPEMYRRHGAAYHFHITGAKFPADFEGAIGKNVTYEGFVGDMESFLLGMDAALVPSLFGAGMQQKIFEPLARGFPTVTHARGLAGYGFQPEKDVITATSLASFCEALESLRSFDRRRELSENAKAKSRRLFSEDALDTIVRNELNAYVRH